MRKIVYVQAKHGHHGPSSVPVESRGTSGGDTSSRKRLKPEDAKHALSADEDSDFDPGASDLERPKKKKKLSTAKGKTAVKTKTTTRRK